MLHDAFKLTIDNLYPPTKGNIDEFSVPGYSNDEVLWEKLGNIDDRSGPDLNEDNKLDKMG